MNQKGISIVQVVIAGALAAGIGLYIAKMSQTAQKSARGFRQQMAIEFMKREIKEAMKDTDACTATLRNLASNATDFGCEDDNCVEQNSVIAGHQINRIIYKSFAGDPITLFEKNVDYDSVEISSIVLDDTDAVGDTPTDSSKEFLKITLLRKGPSFGARDSILTVPVHVNRSESGNVFQTCANSEYVDMKKDICQGFGATYDDDNDTCDIVGLDDGYIGCPPGELFRGIQIDSVEDTSGQANMGLNGFNRRAIYKAICENATANPQQDLVDLVE